MMVEGLGQPPSSVRMRCTAVRPTPPWPWWPWVRQPLVQPRYPWHLCPSRWVHRTVGTPLTAPTVRAGFLSVGRRSRAAYATTLTSVGSEATTGAVAEWVAGATPKVSSKGCDDGLPLRLCKFGRLPPHECYWRASSSRSIYSETTCCAKGANMQ